MSALLALDPGKKQHGVAVFVDGALDSCALIRHTKPPRDSVQRWIELAYIVRDEVCDASTTDEIAIELMQVDGRTGKAQASSILDLAGAGGAIVGLFSADASQASAYTPSQWNRNRAKGPNHAKILRALSLYEREKLLKNASIIDSDGKKTTRRALWATRRPRIDDYETLYRRAVKTSTGDGEHVLDAIGIGLFHFGRLR